jgi:hypothetical protein
MLLTKFSLVNLERINMGLPPLNLALEFWNSAHTKGRIACPICDKTLVTSGNFNSYWKTYSSGECKDHFHVGWDYLRAYVNDRWFYVSQAGFTDKVQFGLGSRRDGTIIEYRKIETIDEFMELCNAAAPNLMFL